MFTLVHHLVLCCEPQADICLPLVGECNGREGGRGIKGERLLVWPPENFKAAWLLKDFSGMMDESIAPLIDLIALAPPLARPGH